MLRSPPERRRGAAASLASLFAKLKPSNRSEQGGTLRREGFWEQQTLESRDTMPTPG